MSDICIYRKDSVFLSSSLLEVQGVEDGLVSQITVPFWKGMMHSESNISTVEGLRSFILFFMKMHFIKIIRYMAQINSPSRADAIVVWFTFLLITQKHFSKPLFWWWKDFSQLKRTLWRYILSTQFIFCSNVHKCMNFPILSFFISAQQRIFKKIKCNVHMSMLALSVSCYYTVGGSQSRFGIVKQLESILQTYISILMSTWGPH